MTMLERLLLFLRNADGGGAGGGDDPAGGGGADPGGGGGAGGEEKKPAGSLADAANALAGDPAGGDKGDKGEKGAAPGPYYPEGLNETLRGQTDRETIDKLFGEINGRPGRPEKADDYKIELPPEMAGKFPDIGKDPVVDMWRGIAHKHGMSQEQFQGSIVELYDEMSKAGLIDEPIDFEKEVEKLIPDGVRDRKEALTAAAQRVNKVADLIKDLHTRGAIDKQDVVVLSSMHASADAVKSFEKLLKLIPSSHGVQPGGQGAAALTKSDVQQQMQDPRYDTLSPKHDPAYRARVDKAWQDLHQVSG